MEFRLLSYIACEGMVRSGLLIEDRVIDIGLALGRYKAVARRAAGIPGWEQDPTFGSPPMRMVARLLAT